MNLDLTSKTALVCGSSQGIGEAIARSLAAQGAKLTLVARNEEKLEKVKRELNGDNHKILPCDLHKKEELTNLLNHMGSSSYDIIINNTGGPDPGDIMNAEVASFQQAIEMHLYASHQIMQQALPGMKARKYGRFINIISTSVKIPIKGLGVSNTIRGAMASWSKTLSLEVGPFGITVNNILPGFIDTERLHGLISSISDTSGKSKEEISQGMIDSIPAGRFGKPEEIGDLVSFLASSAGSYINGVNIPVDGGRTGSM